MKQITKTSLLEISAYRATPQTQVVDCLRDIVEKSRKDFPEITKNAENYIQHIRQTLSGIGIEAFFQQYGLETKEGLAVMSLAEALLRIPDADIANELIHDKLTNIDWQKGQQSESTLMKVSALGLKFVGKLFELENPVSRIADPLVRTTIRQSMKLLGSHFVMGETIGEAMSNAREYSAKGYLFSYDMLGEGARSEAQAELHLAKYLEAVAHIKDKANLTDDLHKRPSISIKLSALHPRYELANIDDVIERLFPKLRLIIDKAMLAGIAVTIDAEESARLDLSLEIFERILREDDYANFDGIGLAVQAYHKQAHKIIDYVIELATLQKRCIPVRLVKGAYWDAEIKKAQMRGLAEYPVFTQKSYTDISYLACAYKMLGSIYIYPQFATHNALTIAEIESAAKGKDFEFQLLHGMGRGVYDQVVAKHRCRIYAPVGYHEELLAYLIRRLLENGANTSFVKKVADLNVPVSEILKDPLFNPPEQNIPLPQNIYGTKRLNSSGIDTGNKAVLLYIQTEINKFADAAWSARPAIKGKESLGLGTVVTNPYNVNHKVGRVIDATISEIKEALDVVYDAYDDWAKTSVGARAEILEKMADLLEENKYEAIALCVYEAGRSLEDAIAEIREAIDFCRYYATEAKSLMQEKFLDSPTGETNCYSLYGRGVFLCISPWNFPLAIFLGQIAAALVTGNTVIAKPAEQTPLMAAFAVKLLFKAGIPNNVISLLIGNGEIIGKYILNDKRTAGVVFTGGIETAKKISSELAHKEGAIIPFIAETGGQNAMIVDSSALIEQTVDDVIISAFGSAGQRCSSLRVLYIQEDILEDFILVLSGAMAELKMGNPADPATVIGPVIDQVARDKIRRHISRMKDKYRFIAASPVDKLGTENGNFIEPTAFLIDSINDLDGEVFGPVLHIISYKHNELNKIIDEINAYGYGLTLGIQSRIGLRAEYIASRAKVGNVYVNRSMIGATVGVQPFGGEGLSGTGPKAGGENYLRRFVTERVYTVNAAAIGGNRALLVNSN
jgi:RHH-type proline utilization regulon transcriptional repressor/proline dehydrogenase/delta 1-pyrroline-5-carboxylate dehydrogenase